MEAPGRSPDGSAVPEPITSNRIALRGQSCLPRAAAQRLDMISRTLSFQDLSMRHFGVSDGLSSSYAEAARVCLDRHHRSPVEFQLNDNDAAARAHAKWNVAGPRIKLAWANTDDATRDGAYALALAALEMMRGLVAVRRAETRTGADYYVGVPGVVLDDLEASLRLEVTGMDRGTQSTIHGRLRQKMEQARQGRSNLPAIATVVGFEALQIVSADVTMT